MSDDQTYSDIPDTPETLTTEQQQREAAIFSARAALADNSGSMFHKGSRIGGEAPQVVSVAHFIATGHREYILGEGQYVETVKSVRVGDFEVTGEQ